MVRLQWMTAGRGIIHSEMPESSGDELLHGFQLWVNLPAKDKMCKPRYQVGGGGCARSGVSSCNHPGFCGECAAIEVCPRSNRLAEPRSHARHVEPPLLALPAQDYQAGDIKTVELSSGASVRVMAGEVEGGWLGGAVEGAACLAHARRGVLRAWRMHSRCLSAPRQEARRAGGARGRRLHAGGLAAGWG